MLTPEERSARARVAAYAMHAQHDPHEITAAATAAVWAKYRQQADPDHMLDPDERDRRARYLMRADLERRRLDGMKARRRRQEADEALARELVGATR